MRRRTDDAMARRSGSSARSPQFDGQDAGIKPLIVEETEVEQAEAADHFGLEPGWRRDLRGFVDSARFEYLSCLIIVINMMSIGAETDYRARYWCSDVPIYFHVIDGVLFLALVLELLARICARGFTAFQLDGWHCTWNHFDLVVVVLQFLDQATTLSAGMSADSLHWKSIRFLRLLRILRLFSILRVTRLVARVSDLRILIAAIVSSLRSLFWVLVLITVQTFFAGIVFTQIATDHKIQVGRSVMAEEAELDMYFGSLDRSMVSLYQTLSDGIHWSEIAAPFVEHVSPILEAAFIVYSAFSVFAVMNIITGMFVGSALENAENEKKRLTLETIGKLWRSLDDDASGDISLDEFMANLQEQHMKALLCELDIVPQDARVLFDLLDEDNSGNITLEELVNGCSRLRGNAKALDLLSHVHNQSVFNGSLLDGLARIEACLSELISGRRKFDIAA